MKVRELRKRLEDAADEDDVEVVSSSATFSINTTEKIDGKFQIVVEQKTGFAW